MARILLTGASGLIGREVAQTLVENGHEVHTLGRNPPHGIPVQHHSVDLLEKIPALAPIRATHLVHCAWYAEPGQFWNAPENCEWVATSLILARAFVAAGGSRMVVAGSCAEYSWDRHVLSEDVLGQAPQTLYGQAKRSLFELLAAAAPLIDLSLAWARIFIPFGAREDSRRLLGTLIAARATGGVADFSAGEQVRDFIHVKDVAGALVALLECNFEGPVNVGSGVGTSVRAFVEEAALIANYLPNICLGTRPMRLGEPESIVADTSRLRELVGFQPRFTLSMGLTEALSHG